MHVQHDPKLGYTLVLFMGLERRDDFAAMVTALQAEGRLVERMDVRKTDTIPHLRSALLVVLRSPMDQAKQAVSVIEQGAQGLGVQLVPSTMTGRELRYAALLTVGDLT
jgi:hypothetical protein